MVDLHSHILFGIDDGAKTIEDSIKLIEYEVNNGVTDIVLTPHYVKDTKFTSNVIDNKVLLDSLKKKVKECNIDVNLYLGNEVYITEDIMDLLKKKEIYTINNSKYLLLELPMFNKCSIMDEVLFELSENNIIPVIAHPERYAYYYKDFEFFKYLIDNGCLLQANIGSIFGIYGKNACKMVKELLKRDMIHLMGSDIHSLKSGIYKKNIRKKLLKILKDEEKVDRLLHNNAMDIINL